MTKPSIARNPETKASDRIIVALDVESADEAREIVSELRGRIGAFKIGMQLFTAAGASFVRELTEAGDRVFLDLKFHDIPNTVAKAGVEAARLGVWMFNVHALGGSEMMRRTVGEVGEFCERTDSDRPNIIAVTVLTSSNAKTLAEIGIEKGVDAEVLNLAKLTTESGMDGVVASALEAELIRKKVASSNFLIVTPGIRPDFATNDDQKRVMTPGEALSRGSDYLVIGRPITKAANMTAAIERICQEIESAS
jgi:orotidine-5'-phosphate decarboxylase